MTIPGWVTVAAKVANSPAGQWARRWMAKRSAAELQRREKKREADEIKRWLMPLLLAAVLATVGGCTHMPSWILRAHVDGYNKLHPDTPVEVEE